MKHPFWIANSTLLLLFLISLGIMYFFRVTISEREEVTPSKYSKVKKEEAIKINIAKIYENDVFDTYEKPQKPVQEPTYVTPIPKPPTPQPISAPQVPEVKFLDPVNITLRGIIVVSDDHTKNRVILADNKTNTEAVYRVGDTIEDAQLIRIFHNKIILLRTNGQQEAVYLTEADAQNDPAYGIIEGWEPIGKKIASSHYAIDIELFLNRIHDLAQFIDLLGLTTEYKNGKSIGIKVGKIDSQSLGYHLGLQTYDLITQINGISTSQTDDRVEIYKNILMLTTNDTITIGLIRKGQAQTIQYSLEHLDLVKNKMGKKVDTTDLLKEKKELESQYDFAPTLSEIRTREKKNMLNYGNNPPSVP